MYILSKYEILFSSSHVFGIYSKRDNLTYFNQILLPFSCEYETVAKTYPVTYPEEAI